VDRRGAGSPDGRADVFEILILQSALDTFLTAAALAALATALAAEPGPVPGSGNTRLPFATAGLLFGLEMLNRPNAGIAVAGVIAGLLAVRRIRGAALLIAGACLALAPVVARNAIVSRQFALISSQGGLNFYIGNNPGATGQYLEVPGVRANIEGQADDTRKVAERAVGHALTDAEVSAYFTGEAMHWMREHPHKAVRLFVKKLALTLNARHQWLDFSYPYYAYDTGSMLWLLASGPWLLVPLGIAGLAAGAAAGRRKDYYVWASFAPWYACGVAVFFVAERYRLPILVPLSIGAGALLAQAPQWSGRRRAAAAVVVTAGAVVGIWPFGTPDGRFEERLRLSKVLMNRHDYPAAASELQAALRLKPADAITEFNLGMALVSAGRAAEGIEHLRHAVDAGVPVEGARYALADAMLRTGDAAGAVRLLRTYSPAPGDSSESCLHVAELAIEAGAPDVADRYLRRALELRPGWEDAERALAQVRSAGR